MPSYNIGLDFGTTNSTISYLTPNGELEAFPYPPPDGQKYIPSFIAYHSADDFTEIGASARTTAAHDSSVETYGNFKMRLPLSESEFGQYFSPNRTPISVTIDYLRELLISTENPHSFSHEKGEITGIVVSVPEIWQRDVYNLGRERLQAIIKKDLGLENQLIQLVSEPVAAAAFYTWETQRRAREEGSQSFSGNILVCDMGGGTFDVSLCRIYDDNKVEVLYFDGQGEKGLESAGVAFDRRVVQKAYTKKHGQRLDENDREFTTLLKDFESVKIGTHPIATKRLTNYLNAPDDKAEDEAYKFNGYAVTLGEVNEAFTPIGRGIANVIQRVNAHIQQQGLAIDRIFMVGGFCQFSLVQKAINDALGIAKNDSRIDKTFNITSSVYAISYGACLIANGLVDPTEKYIHSLGIVLKTLNACDEKVEKEITLIEGGSNLDALAQTNFYPIAFDAIVETNSANIAIIPWIQRNSRGKKHHKQESDVIKIPDYCGGKCRIGMRVDRSQIAYLVIEQVNTRSLMQYELGNMIAKLFPGFVFFEEEESEE